MAEDTCTNIWIGQAPNDDSHTVKVEKTCGYDLAEARKVRGDALVRCPQCGQKLGGRKPSRRE